MSDCLDLDAVLPPGPPGPQTRQLFVGARVSLPVAAWIREQSRLHRVPQAQFIRRCIEHEYRGGGYPADVRDWLAAQAAQCGRPGDIDGALYEVIRHLAAKWPNGGRLIHDDDRKARTDEIVLLRAQVDRLKYRNEQLRGKH